MKKLIAIALLMVVIYSCGTSKSITTPTTPVETKTVAVKEIETINPEIIGPTVSSVSSVEEYMDELAEGKSLFESKCANCHDLPNPKDHTVENWHPIMLSMQIKAEISDQERIKIYNYVTKS
ncbi:hypothetical protein [Flavobacterium sp.]|uniref:hypothetical protein n=1 Tax=Flavobacterium sp. TaxID=239 RepID=UPI003753BF1B